MIIKKQIFSLQIKLLALLILITTSGCSHLNKREKSSKEKFNEINLEIIANYSKAISKDPNNELFYLERGKAKYEYGDFIGAIRDFDNSFKINSNIEILFFRANAKFDYGDHNGAIKDYEKVIFLDKLKDQVFYNIASSQLILGNYKSAITNYSKSIEIDPLDYTSYLQKGNANWRLNN